MSDVNIVQTVEQVIEDITHTTSPQASVGTLLDWIIGTLTGAINQGGMAATTEAVQAHVADLQANKDAIVSAVAATPPVGDGVSSGDSSNTDQSAGSAQGGV